jgi:hypothetical protein
MQTYGVSKANPEADVMEELSSWSEVCIESMGSLIGIFGYHYDAKLPYVLFRNSNGIEMSLRFIGSPCIS